MENLERAAKKQNAGVKIRGESPITSKRGGGRHEVSKRTPHSGIMVAVKKITLPAVLLTAYLPVSSLSAQGRRVEINNLRYHTHPNFTRIVLDIGSLREYSAGEELAPGRIFVDILQASLNPILQGQAYPVKTDYLSSIHITQKTPSTVRMTADVDFANLESYRVYHLFDPFRVVLDIYPNKTSGTDLPRTSLSKNDVAKPPNPLDSGYTMIRQLGLGVKTIVLDPGHGGTDPGCIGKSGLREKDVALDVALALKKKLTEKNEFHVILTRETDIYVPLEDRTVIANQKRADVFVSIHANASPNKKRTGIEAFYLNFSPDPAVNEIAARENATSAKNISQMTDIIKKIVLNSKFAESKALAASLHKNLQQSLSKKYGAVNSLGVKGGPFWVLIGGEMPSVLIEISHLSNAQEESRLKTQAFRMLIVQALYDGIMEYVRSLGKG